MTPREIQPRRLLQRGTVFQVFANNNLDVKINTLFDTGAMKGVISLEMYKKIEVK